MTSFEAGFIKYARDCGLSDTQAVYILKRALDNPEMSDVVRKQPQGKESPEELDALKDVYEQDEVDKEMSNFKKQLHA
jgi:hypothetical protein